MLWIPTTYLVHSSDWTLEHQLKIKTPKEYFKKLNYNFPIIADVPEFNLNYERGMLLYALVEKNKPKTIVDIGTAGGYSALCMAKALTDFKIDGRVYTIDLEPHNKIKQYILKIKHIDYGFA